MCRAPAAAGSPGSPPVLGPHVTERPRTRKNVNGFGTIPQEENHVRIFRTAVVFLMITALAGPLARAQADRAQSETTLRQLEQDLAATAARGDWHLWDQVVAPEWTMIDRFGQQLDKPGVLAMAKSRKAVADSFRITEVQVKFLKDDVALVTARLTIVGGPAGRKITVSDRCMDIFVQRQGKWLVVASQATPVKDLR